MAKDGKINIVIGKGLSIPGHAEVFEPVLNLLHRSHQGPSWLSFGPRQQRVYINKFAIARPFKKRGSASSMSVDMFRPDAVGFSRDRPSKTLPRSSPQIVS